MQRLLPWVENVTYGMRDPTYTFYSYLIVSSVDEGNSWPVFRKFWTNRFSITSPSLRNNNRNKGTYSYSTALSNSFNFGPISLNHCHAASNPPTRPPQPLKIPPTRASGNKIKTNISRAVLGKWGSGVGCVWGCVWVCVRGGRGYRGSTVREPIF